MVAFFQVTWEHTSYSGSYMKFKNSFTVFKVYPSIQGTGIQKHPFGLKWIPSFQTTLHNNHHNSKGKFS